MKNLKLNEKLKKLVIKGLLTTTFVLPSGCSKTTVEVVQNKEENKQETIVETTPVLEEQLENEQEEKIVEDKGYEIDENGNYLITKAQDIKQLDFYQKSWLKRLNDNVIYDIKDKNYYTIFVLPGETISPEGVFTPIETGEYRKLMAIYLGEKFAKEPEYDIADSSACEVMNGPGWAFDLEALELHSYSPNINYGFIPDEMLEEAREYAETNLAKCKIK
ncbi:MAG: hypothetical protein WBH68_08450 [Erysipelotrichaceae bacterium]|jgi:hypothetical protein